MAACAKVFNLSSARTTYSCRITPAKDGPQRQVLLGGLSTDLCLRRVGKSVPPLAPKPPPLNWDGTWSFERLARFTGRRRRYFRCGEFVQLAFILSARHGRNRVMNQRRSALQTCFFVDQLNRHLPQTDLMTSESYYRRFQGPWGMGTDGEAGGT
jgi:hypothetical protein